jgi:hypothetical protein
MKSSSAPRPTAQEKTSSGAYAGAVQLLLFEQAETPRNADGVSLKGCTHIYAPAGQAGAYAALACNPYRGCGLWWKYSYAPGFTYQPRAEFNAGAVPRPNFISNLRKEASKYQLAGITEQVMLSFTTDRTIRATRYPRARCWRSCSSIRLASSGSTRRRTPRSSRSKVKACTGARPHGLGSAGYAPTRSHAQRRRLTFEPATPITRSTSEQCRGSAVMRADLRLEVLEQLTSPLSVYGLDQVAS